MPLELQYSGPGGINTVSTLSSYHSPRQDVCTVFCTCVYLWPMKSHEGPAIALISHEGSHVVWHSKKARTRAFVWRLYWISGPLRVRAHCFPTQEGWALQQPSSAELQGLVVARTNPPWAGLGRAYQRRSPAPALSSWGRRRTLNLI